MSITSFLSNHIHTSHRLDLIIRTLCVDAYPLPGGQSGTFTDPVSPGTYQYSVRACKPVCSAPSNYQTVIISGG